ncbi:MAG: hypothetical protein Q8880_05315, partial [Bacteroidota bacterium]|nr:hypothetical protein [Bacteroidota bacterium]
MNNFTRIAKLIILSAIFFSYSIKSFGQTSGDFRTKSVYFQNWSDPTIWQKYNGSTWINANAIPSSTTNVIISGNSLVYLDADETCKNLFVEGGSYLTFTNYYGANAHTLTVTSNVTIDSANGGGYLQGYGDVAAITANGTLYVGGSINNYGFMDLSYDDNAGNQIFVDLIFFGASASTLNLGAISQQNNFYRCWIQKNAATTEVNMALNNTFTVNYADNSGFLCLKDPQAKGIWRISGNSAMTNNVFNSDGVQGYGINSTATLTMDNPWFTVPGTAGSLKVDGTLRLKQVQQFSVGTTKNDSLVISSGASLIIEKGSLISSSGVVGTGTPIYNQSGGTLYTGYLGTSSSTKGIFDFRGTPNFTMSGGSIVLVRKGNTTTNNDWRLDGTPTITGGIIKLGGISQSNRGKVNWNFKGSLSGLQTFVSTTDTNNVWLLSNCTGYRTVNVVKGTTFKLGDGSNTYTYTMKGDTFRLDGNFTGTVGEKLLFNGSNTQKLLVSTSYKVGGKYNATINRIELNNSNGLVLAGTNVILNVDSLTLTNGTFDFSGSNKLNINAKIKGSGTLGGSTSSYLSIYGADSTNVLTFASGKNNLADLYVNRTKYISLGSDININDTLILTNGIVNTGAYKIALSAAKGLTNRTNGYVKGNLMKSFNKGTKIYTYHLGTDNGYSSALISFANISVAGSLTATVTQSVHPNALVPLESMQRYWTLTNTGMSFTTYDATFTYLASDFNTNFIEASDEATMNVGNYTSSWSYPVIGTRNTAGPGGSVQITGVSNTGDFTAMKASGCTANAGSNVSVCSGLSTTLNASGGTSYSWSPATGLSSSVIYNPVANPTTTTTYTVSAVTGTCTATASVIVAVNAIPTVTATATKAAICNGSADTLIAGGATTYAWNNGLGSGTPKVISPTTTTTYTVTGTTASGCSNTASVTVTVNAIPTVTATATKPAICNGSTDTLIAGGATTYAWNNGLGSGATKVISPTTTTTYTVTGTSASGCSNTSSVTVTVNAIPTVTATATKPAICNGSTDTLIAGGATTYVWNNGLGSGTPKVISPTTTTTYTVTGTTASGCSNTSSVTVTVNA